MHPDWEYLGSQTGNSGRCLQHTVGLWTMCIPPPTLDTASAQGLCRIECEQAYCTHCADTMIVPGTTHCHGCQVSVEEMQKQKNKATTPSPAKSVASKYDSDSSTVY